MADVECIRLQNQQFKALSCIYLDEFHATKDTTPQKFTILCKPYIGNESEYQINLMFEFTPSYPKSPLKYEIEPVVGITRDNLQQMTINIENLLYDNRNRPLVYDIVEETRFWIHEYLVEGKAYQEEEEQIHHKKQEIFERPKFTAFTQVTVESFLAWKREFELKKRQEKEILVQNQKKQTEIKPTGKQWFLGKKDEIEEDDEEEEEDEDEDEEDEDYQEQEQQKKEIPRDDVENNPLF